MPLQPGTLENKPVGFALSAIVQRLRETAQSAPMPCTLSPRISVMIHTWSLLILGHALLCIAVGNPPSQDVREMRPMDNHVPSNEHRRKEQIVLLGLGDQPGLSDNLRKKYREGLQDRSGGELFVREGRESHAMVVARDKAAKAVMAFHWNEYSGRNVHGMFGRRERPEHLIPPRVGSGRHHSEQEFKKSWSVRLGSLLTGVPTPVWSRMTSHTQDWSDSMLIRRQVARVRSPKGSDEKCGLQRVGSEVRRPADSKLGEPGTGV